MSSSNGTHGVTQLPHPVHRVVAPGHADPDLPLGERRNVGDDVDVAHPHVRRAADHLLDRSGNLTELGPHLTCAESVARNIHPRENVFDVVALLVQAGLLPNPHLLVTESDPEHRLRRGAS